ncbi:MULTISPECIES: hypothetical protein [Streptomyces]|uniref:Uncharacterized protein n=1 Tax=Streptomyces coelicolor (strain ATCC BAA-471 / A3(2) / M145) TaxID=100226 RepID=Q9ZBY0_STRCO|nr:MULTISPECIES: hypothetical protein [Streptomyces]MDX2925257.1 hypothetical protein [Streptomyces sp. NRRL_B-16638]MYU43476.1 hypothetical protein [Streptomyces sp. SID7813]NSL78707.1 hypothetical protein [Streptomyces coelicolor]QFI43948.1 hypothetical protein FQ762_20360 [Streptomyces coelicolor A3(2)]QKN67589.1 hypothetical protein HCU77_20115 [Streptomyces coelicolor]
MIEGMEHLPTTQSAVTALRAVAEEYALEIEVTDDIGADQTSRHSAAGVGVTTDADDSLPHEAFVEFGGVPRVSVRLFHEGDALLTVENVEFPDVERDDVPAFLRSVFGGLAYVQGRRFPPGYRLIVPLPGDRAHKEHVSMLLLTPWLSSRVR